MKTGTIVFYGLLILGLVTSCSETNLESKEQKPNILYIMADDHTSQAWGIYGGILEDYVQNTNIKRLADEGMVLENCLVSNSICTPSRATIMTGQYSHYSGVKYLYNRLDGSKNNVAKILQGGGYQTALIGKWHLKNKPTGFDHFAVLPGQGRYWDPILKTEETWENEQNQGGTVYKGFSADVIADKTIEWLKQRDPSKPFMMMTHFKATHEPFDYPDRFKDLYKDEDIPVPFSLYDNGPQTTQRVLKGQSLDNLQARYLKATANKEHIREGHTLYPDLPFSVDGLVSDEARYKTYQKFVKDFMRSGAAIDDNIGKLLRYLDESGLAENTIVIYTADQGYFLGEHGWFDKRLIYEQSIRMPFVIRYPKEISPGTRNDDIIENVDFSALFADYAGVDYPTEMQGVSFRENLKGSTPENWRTYAYYRYWEHSKDRPGHFGVKGKRYKLAFYYGNGLEEGAEDASYWEFYDLKSDPNEIRNLYNHKRYKSIIEELKKEILNKRQALGDTDTDNPEIIKIIEKYWD